MSWIVESRCAIAMRRAAAHQHLQCVANQQLGIRIHAGRGLVQDEDARIERQRPGERQQLLLSDRERRAALRDRRVEPRGSRSMNVSACTASIAARTASSPIAALPEPDIARDRARKEMHVLQHQAEHRPQAREIHLADVDAVDRDPALLHVVEPQQQADDRRLARPVAPTMATR